MRIINRLDVKEGSLIKGIQLEGWRKYGDPVEEAQRQYKSGIDEIFIVDVVASLYGRNNSFELLKKIAKNVFVPITLSGEFELWKMYPMHSGMELIRLELILVLLKIVIL